MMMKLVLVLCMCVATVKGQDYGSRPPPAKKHIPPVNKCAAVLCPQVYCPNSYTPAGECCPVCPHKPPTINCNLVDCKPDMCPNPIIPPGQCCGVCQPDCAHVNCLHIICAFGAVKLQGDCCHSCSPTPPTPDCSAVLCLEQSCPNPITPKGECCAICPPPPSVCYENGRTYQQGENVPRGVCDVCRCASGGRVVCAIIDCFTKPCPTGPLIRLPGKCCAECTVGCTIGSVTYRPGETVPTANPCQYCSCSKSGIVCAARRCQKTPCANPITPPGQCCAVCPSTGVCIENGKTYQQGENVLRGVCDVCKCSSGGKVICASIDCHQHCSTGPLIQLPGQCCAECPVGCTIGSVTYRPGETVPTHNPCQYCSCSESGIICAARRCQKTPCANPITPPGQCCAVCPSTGGCTVDGITFGPGQLIPQSNPCVSCRCDGTSNMIVCDLRKCDPLSGQCCPTICPPTGGCTDKGITYPEGDSIPDPDPCKVCYCMGGKKECAMQGCMVTCPNGAIPTPTPGKCCPTCPKPPTGCVWKGKSYPEGSDMPDPDPCAGCRCYQGQRQCNQIFCDWPFCGVGIQPVYTPGACCPGCPPTGDIPNMDPCKSCECTSTGQIICATRQCAIPNCPVGVVPITKKGHCCPSCPSAPPSPPPIDCRLVRCAWPTCGPGSLPSTKPGECCPSCPVSDCNVNGKNYPEGGKVLCEQIVCPRLQCRNPVQPRGQCCKVCPNDGGYG